MLYKVLYVIDNLEVGGAEKITVMLSNLMVEEGHNTGLVTILYPGKLIGNINSKIKHFNLNRKSKWSIKYAKTFMEFSEDYDLIHIHLRHNLKWVLFWSIILRKKLIIIFHDHSNTVLRFNLLYILHKCVISHIVVNRNLYEKQAQNSPLFPRVYFLENIIKSRPPQIKSHNDNQTLSIVLVSNFRRLKNIEFAIEFFDILLKKYKNNIHLDIYGQAIDQIYLEEIVLLISSKNLDNNISIIQNCYNIEDRLTHYQLALHSSKLEAGPLVLLEYLSQGVPFLSFKTGEVVEKIKEIFPQFIVNDFIYQTWINQFNILVTSDLEQVREKMISYFNSNISEKEYYKKCLKIYQSTPNS